MESKLKKNLTIDVYRTSENSPVNNLTYSTNVGLDMNFGMAVGQIPIPQNSYLTLHHNSREEQELMYSDGEPQGRLVGMYTQKEREAKIRKYKKKLQRWRQCNKDAFNGRSRVAKKKLRYFGRFIKSEDFKDKILTDDQIIQNNEEMEDVLLKGDYNKLVDLITQNPSEIK